MKQYEQIGERKELTQDERDLQEYLDRASDSIADTSNADHTLVIVKQGENWMMAATFKGETPDVAGLLRAFADDIQQSKS